MGKRKVENMSLIDSSLARNVTYCKRKRGLLKKAMEISILCGQQVFMICYDQTKEKLVMYRSSDDLDAAQVTQLISGPLT